MRNSVDAVRMMNLVIPEKGDVSEEDVKATEGEQ